MNLKVTLFSLLALLAATSVSCNKNDEQDSPAPETETHTEEIPELFEKEFSSIASRGWKDLSNKLGYYYTHLLSKGIISGTGPDKNEYSIHFSSIVPTLSAAFSINDKNWMTISGELSPLSVVIEAGDSKAYLYPEKKGELFLKVDNLGFTLPTGSKPGSDFKVDVYMNDSPIGYLCIEEFEDPDFSSGRYPVIHFTDSATTLSYDIDMSIFYMLVELFGRK